jgi:hypothetical protein
MFNIHFYNFGYSLGRTFSDLADAKAKAVVCGFECNIVEMNTGKIVATYSPIGGFK